MKQDEKQDEKQDMEQDIRPYLTGERLWGDDFSLPEVEAWYRDEENGYYETLRRPEESRPEESRPEESRPEDGAQASAIGYGYHGVNDFHGFGHLPPHRLFDSALSVGGATGHELVPLFSRIGHVTILEACERFYHSDLQGKPLEYVKPRPSGKMEFHDQSFDLITALGVLHHMPNVTFVFSEMCRVLRPGGYMIVREPITSMGDWRQPRAGLTKRERGIPLGIFDRMVETHGLKVIVRHPCMNDLIYVMQRRFGFWAFNKRFTVVLDHWFSKLFSWNRAYHSTGRLLTKFRNTAVYFVLLKPPSSLIQSP